MADAQISQSDIESLIRKLNAMEFTDNETFILARVFQNATPETESEGFGALESLPGSLELFRVGLSEALTKAKSKNVDLVMFGGTTSNGGGIIRTQT